MVGKLVFVIAIDKDIQVYMDYSSSPSACPSSTNRL